jgi:chaperonin GroES
MLKPVEDKIIVRRDVQEQTTSSGFILAGAAEEKQDTGEVLAVGPGLVLNNGDKIVPEVEVGQKVLFGKYSGTEVEHDGENLLILAYRDVFAVLG